LFNRSYSPAAVRTALPTRFALRGRPAEVRAGLKSPPLRALKRRTGDVAMTGTAASAEAAKAT